MVERQVKDRVWCQNEVDCAPTLSVNEEFENSGGPGHTEAGVSEQRIVELGFSFLLPRGFDCSQFSDDRDTRYKRDPDDIRLSKQEANH